MRLPPLKKITDKFFSKKIQRSIDYLIQNRSSISKYKDIEDFILRHEEYATNTGEDEKILEACEHHLFNVRSKFSNELWAKEFFLGISVIDQLLFSAFAHTNETNPILHALEIIRDSEVLRPGFVVYPIHSFGVMAAGLLHSYSSSRVQFQVPGYGLTVSPQTNSFEGTISFLKESASILGVKKTLPIDLLEHWMRSRPTKWLEKNPLMVLKVHSFPGGYYENQFFLIYKLKIATTLLMMLNAFQTFESSKEGTLFNTSRVNNWETLDILHYILFFPKPRSKKLSGDCIPMNSGKATLADLSCVPVDVDPRFWRRRMPWAENLIAALDHIGKNYLKYSIGKPKNNVKSRVYRKFFRSLEFYRKSNRITDDEGENAIYLAIAFEILLTDNYGVGVTGRIIERVSKLLKGIKGNRKLKEAVNDLYKVRGQYVHTGSVSDSLCLKTAQVAYIKTFLSLSSRLTKLPYKDDEPIKRLIQI
jgi:hypothetical protein